MIVWKKVFLINRTKNRHRWSSKVC